MHTLRDLDDAVDFVRTSNKIVVIHIRNDQGASDRFHNDMLDLEETIFFAGVDFCEYYPTPTEAQLLDSLPAVRLYIGGNCVGELTEEELHRYQLVRTINGLLG